MSTSPLLNITASRLSVYKGAGRLFGHHNTHVHHPASTMAPLRLTMSTYQLIVLVTLMQAVAFFDPVSGRACSTDFSENRSKRSFMSMPQKYCGKNLSTALQLVCNGTYNPLFKREEISDPEMGDYPSGYDQAYPLKSRRSAYAMLERLGARYRRQSGGIYEECCIKGCTQNELHTYCGP